MALKVDKPAEIRKEEEIDLGSLKAYMAGQLALEGELSVLQYPSGFSNLTYLVRFGNKEYVLRRPPFGVNIRSAHDMSREYRFLTALRRTFEKVPRPVFYCDDTSVIGAPFYLMEKLNGVILRGFMKSDEIPQPKIMEAIAYAAIETLAALHAIDIGESGLEGMGKPEGYVDRQIKGWSDRYVKSQTDQIGEIEEVMLWLPKNKPERSGKALIHNDFKYDNLVLDPSGLTKIVGVLDWEMATIGDPMMDLGTALAYWIEPSDPEIMIKLNVSSTHWPGNPSRMEVATRYAKISGAGLDNILFYYVFGLFKNAVIVQQIYARYRAGHTSDSRFANLIHAVKACGTMAARAIELNKISSLYPS